MGWTCSLCRSIPFVLGHQSWWISPSSNLCFLPESPVFLPFTIYQVGWCLSKNFGFRKNQWRSTVVILSILAWRLLGRALSYIWFCLKSLKFIKKQTSEINCQNHFRHLSSLSVQGASAKCSGQYQWCICLITCSSGHLMLSKRLFQLLWTSVCGRSRSPTSVLSVSNLSPFVISSTLAGIVETVSLQGEAWQCSCTFLRLYQV